MGFDREGLVSAYRRHEDAIGRDSIPADLVATLTPAAVLVPVVLRPEGLSVLLTQRSEALKNHAGQISFPGGRQDPGDPDLAFTALRETEEEIGLAPERVELVGPLATYATITRFVITPFLGLVQPDFSLRLQADEVVDAFEAPLDFLLDPVNHRRRELIYEGRPRSYYEIPWQGRHIWGATAAMLRNLSRHLSPERYR